MTPHFAPNELIQSKNRLFDNVLRVCKMLDILTGIILTERRQFLFGLYLYGHFRRAWTNLLLQCILFASLSLGPPHRRPLLCDGFFLLFLSHRGLQLAHYHSCCAYPSYLRSLAEVNSIVTFVSVLAATPSPSLTLLLLFSYSISE